MMPQLKRNNFRKTLFAVHSLLSQKRGSILVYIIVVMLIFAVLGVAMVSLFSTSISSSATANESRRAFYLAEAGLRYGLSELRKVNGFTTSNIATLNETLYKMPPSGDFDLTVFGAWFKSPSKQEVPAPVSGSMALSVELEKGKIPAGFFTRLNNMLPDDLYLVVASLDPTSTTQKPNDNEMAKVNGITPGSDTSFQFILNDTFIVGRDKRICIAVQPKLGPDQRFTPSASGSAESLELKQKATAIFPKTDGAFLFAGNVYFYRNAVEDKVNGLFRLNGISAGPNVSANQVTVTAADYILLAPNNYFITSKGKSGNVDFGGDMDYAAALASRSAADLSEPDIGPVTTSEMSHIESATGYTVGDTDTQGDYLQIGSGVGMGAMWYNQDIYLGGSTDYCSNGRCWFKQGLRAFFTLEYSGTGDGLIFALINGIFNDSTSVGGDGAQSELLGYAGDGRNADGSYIVDSRHGLDPPKIGLEFDAKVNYDYQDEQALKYCDGSSLNACTRNDPGSIQSSVCDITSNSSGTKDAVQYVFWGNSSLNILCRGNDPSYDDNRHNASGSGSRNWAFNTTWDINSSPALAPDGTIYAGNIYIGSNSTNFYAVNPDGLERWHIDISGFWYSPTLSKTGRIYVGSSDKKLYAIEDNGNSASILWTFDTRNKGTVNGGAITTKPAINNNGDTIFFGCDDGFFYAVSSGGNEIWRFDTNSIFGLSEIKTSPALSPPPGPSINENYVYFGSTRGDFYAKRTDNGGGLWSVSISAGIRSSPAVRSSDGVVYIGADNGNLYAFNGTTGNPPADSNFPFNAGSSAITSSPAVDSNGTVYFGYSDHKLYAIGGSTGSKIWDFTTGGIVASSPAIDSNNHIYFGSNDKKIYALYNDGTLKWSISTLNIGPGGDVKGRPAVQVDGTVYTGCSDFRLYSINQFANPKNFKDKLITYDTNKVGGEPVVVDSTDDWLKGASSKGPWAVRMEVVRNLLDPSNGTYAYSLKTWLRQCSRPDCSDTTANDPLGTFFEDTRIEYSPPTHLPQLAQTINTLEGTPSVFERFLFGFTSQTASGDVQTATIRNFKLSFIRPNDPIVTVDPNWP